jgi:hypothetical protein
MFQFYLKYKVKIILFFGRGIRIILTATYEIKKYQASVTIDIYITIILNTSTNCFLSYKGIKILRALYILIRIIVIDTDINQYCESILYL